MADEEKADSVQKSYRLPRSVVDWIVALRESGVMGRTDADVVRSLLEKAIRDLINEQYVRKYKETLDELKALKKEL